MEAPRAVAERALESQDTASVGPMDWRGPIDCSCARHPVTIPLMAASDDMDLEFGKSLFGPGDRHDAIGLQIIPRSYDGDTLIGGVAQLIGNAVGVGSATESLSLGRLRW